MAKYSYELQKKIVEGYLSETSSYLVLDDKYQIDYLQIRRRVISYKHFGDESLMRSRNKREHSVEFELEAIIRYETSECSYQQLALKLGLTLLLEADLDAIVLYDYFVGFPPDFDLSHSVFPPLKKHI